jgi:hypothetical protein
MNGQYFDTSDMWGTTMKLTQLNPLFIVNKPKMLLQELPQLIVREFGFVSWIITRCVNRLQKLGISVLATDRFIIDVRGFRLVGGRVGPLFNRDRGVPPKYGRL